MSKALLIKSQIDKNGGEVGKWNNFNNAPSYIQGIHTGKMLEDISAEKLGALISGIPTPWARAKLFKFALCYHSCTRSKYKHRRSITVL